MNVAACKAWRSGAAVALLIGCQSTSFQLRVQAPGETDLSGSTARLIIEDEPLCGGGVLFFGRTDAAGKLWVVTPACGEARLVVSRLGRATSVQKLDTCDVQSLDVVLGPAPPARAAADACSEVAQNFAAAWVENDHERARSFWQNPDDYPRHAREPANEKPYAIDIGPSELGGKGPAAGTATVAEETPPESCRVLITERYDGGCEFGWQLVLAAADGSWRLRSMGYVPPANP